MLSDILLSLLPPYVEEIISYHQCGFRRNISAADQIFCIRQCWGKWEYNGTIYQLFIYFEKSYDSVMRKLLYNIPTEVGILIELIRLIKKFDRNLSKVHTGKNLMHFLLRISQTRRRFISIASQLCFRMCHQEFPRKSERFELNGKRQLLVCADDVSILGESINTIQKIKKLYWRLVESLVQNKRRGNSPSKCRTKS
jgi:hypothetical protein